MQVGPQHGAVDLLGRVQHVMMVVPVDAEEDVAEDVGEEHRHERARRFPPAVVRHLQLQHHNRDDDGEHAVAECFQSMLAHDRQCSGFRRR
jgi:hypothetical protein